jgi:hypothetical protein
MTNEGRRNSPMSTNSTAASGNSTGNSTQPTKGLPNTKVKESKIISSRN